MDEQVAQTEDIKPAEEANVEVVAIEPAQVDPIPSEPIATESVLSDTIPSESTGTQPAESVRTDPALVKKTPMVTPGRILRPRKEREPVPEPKKGLGYSV